MIFVLVTWETILEDSLRNVIVNITCTIHLGKVYPRNDPIILNSNIPWTLNWSFDKQKSSNFMHGGTNWIFHVKSSRKMFWSKQRHFHDFLMISEMKSIMCLSISWEVRWRKDLSLTRSSLSQSEKWWTEWKVKFLKCESVFLLKILVWEWKPS